MADTANKEKKVFDVAKPGKSAPSSSSRPVITTHKIMVEDPMVAKTAPPVQEPKKSAAKAVPPSTGEDTDAAAVESNEQLLSSKRITIMPISHDDEQTKPETKPLVKTDTVPEAKEQMPAEPASPEPAPLAETKQQPESPENTAGAPETSDVAAMDAVLEQVDAGKKNQETDADKAKQEQLEKLIASKEYYLPIDEAKHIHAVERFLAIALLVSLLAAAGVYLAVDAGLIKANVNLPLDLIKN